MSNIIAVIFTFVGISTISAGIVPPGKIEITVESKDVYFHPVTSALYQAQDTIDIILSSIDLDISGINLKVSTTPDYLFISEILPGSFIDSCRWEYFEVREVRQKPDDSLNIWQITAVSEIIPDSTRPLCYRPGEDVTLARLIVQGNANEVPEGAQTISFYWESCADNSISDKSGNKLFVSSSVFEPNGDLRTSDTDSTIAEPFPTRSGTPPGCINDKNPNRPLRRIELHGGSMNLRLKFEE